MFDVWNSFTEPETSNIELRTPNIERKKPGVVHGLKCMRKFEWGLSMKLQCPAIDVQCSMFDVRCLPFTGLRILILAIAFLSIAWPSFANIPGGGNGTGPDVTLVNNGNGTVTMANGIVSILCSTSGATINQINYTYNNSGTMVTNNLLAGGNNGGQLYWETGGFGTGSFNYSAAANTGNYCEIDLLSKSATNGVMDVHFSMLRGSPGFYVTTIFFTEARTPP